MDSRSDTHAQGSDNGQRDTDDDGQWLTYVQLAEKRGVTLRAVMRQAQRQKLRRQPGNDGKTLVWVPRDAVMRTSPRPVTDQPRPKSDDVAVAVAALERAHARELSAKDALIGELRSSVMRAELALGTAQEALHQMTEAEMARKAGGALGPAQGGVAGVGD